MKKIFPLIISLLAMLLSVSAIELDTAEATTENAAILDAALTEDSVYYSYTDIVDMVTGMEQLALLPSQGESGAAATSYDRASEYDAETDTYIKWADYEVSNYNGSRPYESNADGWGYIEDVNDDRGAGILAADIKGAGAVFRSWFATVGDGCIDIYIDGATEPTISMPTSEFVDSSVETSQFYGLDNMAYTLAEGKNNYTPITFNESCKIILRDGWGQYFQFSYRLFADGISVEPIGSTFTDEQKAALMACNQKLGNCGEAPDTYEGETTTEADCTIPAGERVSVYKAEGEGAITRFKVKFNTALLANRETAMQKLELSMYWDGEESPSVWAPFGDFFATPGGKVYHSLPLGLDDDGTFYCYWYMPYANGAEIVLENLSDMDYDLHIEVSTAPLKRDIGEYARFHTKWSMNRFLPEREDRGSDQTVLKVTGAGRFLGFNLHLFMITGGYWWGEGDEKFFVDGEKFPSTFGTGSEDYFGYAWGSGDYFEHAFHSQNWITGIFAESSNINNVRFQIGDNVPFHTEFEASIEKFFDNDTDQYATTAFFYLSADGVDPYTPVKYQEGEEADYRYMALNHVAAEFDYGTLLYRNDFERYANAANDQTTWGNATYISSDLNETRLSAEDSTVAYTDDPLNESNHVLEITQSGNAYTRATLYFAEDFDTAITKYGEYTLLGDVYVPEDFGNATIGPMAFVYSDVSGHPGANKSVVWASGSTGTWQKGNVFSFSIFATQDLDLGTADNFNWGADGDNLRYVYFANMAAPTEGKSFYIDNLRLYYFPTCRIAYDLGGLESLFPGLPEYEYLKEGTTSADITEAAANVGYDFKGWSKVSGDSASAQMNYTITADDIEAQDVTLYAILEKNADASSYVVAADNTVISGVTGTAVLTASEPTDWTVDLGTTEAVISTDDTTLTIIAAGYAGEVKVTAASRNDTAQTKEITVRLIGADKWKPGADVVSGTAKPFDFEGITEDDVWYGYANNWANAFVLMADPLDSNNKVMGIRSDVYNEWVTLHWAHSLSTPIEIDRPIKISYDYYGTTTDNWVVVGEGVNDFNNDVYVIPGSLNPGVTEWQHYSDTPSVSETVKAAHADGITMMAFENGGNVNGTNEYYIDNVSFIPYYKIEYRTTDNLLLDVQYALPEDGVYTPDAAYLEALGAEGFYLSADKTGGLQTSVSLANSDLVLYLDVSPVTYNDSSIRVGSLTGIRFRASVTNVQRSGAEEYGFLVARKSVLELLQKELSFDLEGEEAVDGASKVIVSGAAYKSDGTVDIIYAQEVGKIQFTGVMTGIPETSYDEVVTARPYIKYEVGGKAITLYGEPVSRSLKEVAKAIQAANGSYYNEHKEEIDLIAGAD